MINWLSKSMLLIKPDIENKIPDINNLATKAALNTKTREIEFKIPDNTNLVIKASLSTKVIEIENKISYTTGLITTLEFNILTKTVSAKKVDANFFEIDFQKIAGKTYYTMFF